MSVILASIDSNFSAIQIYRKESSIKIDKNDYVCTRISHRSVVIDYDHLSYTSVYMADLCSMFN